jgi:tetratricopeptide (TPR) repeat protein
VPELTATEQQAYDLIKQANQLAAAEPEQAVHLYQAAMALLPDSPIVGAYNLPVGDMLYRLQRYSEAAAAYQQAIDFVPEHAQAWCGLGQCQLRQGRYEDALHSCAQSRTLEPANAEAWYYSALAYGKLGDDQHARDCLQQALKLRPAWKAAAQQDSLLKQYLATKPRWQFWKN